MVGGLLRCGHGFLLGSRSLRLGCGRFLVCLSCARDVGLWFGLLLVCLSRAVRVILLACFVLVVPVCGWLVAVYQVFSVSG